jgi:tetrahydromethanopterin S-methyltransferase subunit A
LLHGRRTRGVTEAVVIYLASIVILLAAGVFRGQIAGLYIGLAAMSVSMTLQTFWLGWRSRPVLMMMRARDSQALPGLEPVPEEGIDGFNRSID